MLKKIAKCMLTFVLTAAIFVTAAPITTMANDAPIPWTRLAGSNRYATSVEIAKKELKALGKDKFDCAVLASGKNFPDALTGCTLAGQKEAPMLLVNPGNINDTVGNVKNLVSSGSTVYILGGDAAVPSSIDGQLSSAGYKVKRLAGSNRYDTNLDILKETKVANMLLVASGKNYADALSASATGNPLMVVGDKLSDAQKAYLKSKAFDNVYILGGSAAVSASTENEIKTAIGMSVVRLAGANRFATSRMIAERFSINADVGIIAYAKNYPDGLSAGPLALFVNGPVLLVSDSSFEDARSFIACDTTMTSGLAIGGTGVISDSTADAVFAGKYYCSHNWVTTTVVDQPACDDYGTRWVEDTPAYDETVVVKEAWTETIQWCYFPEDGYKAYSADDAYAHSNALRGKTYTDENGNVWRYSGNFSSGQDVINHPAETTTVHHEATGHNEQYVTQHHDAVTHTETKCSKCGVIR